MMTNASKTKTVEELSALVLKFDMLELPGQPKAMHMGTANLVHDLLKKARELEAENAELVKDNERAVQQAQAAIKEIAELRKDAERYRWLRINGVQQSDVLLGAVLLAEGSLDRKIDAAIVKENSDE